MARHRTVLSTLLALLTLPASAAGSVTTWQTCSVGPAGDTALCTSGGFPQDLTSAAGALWVTTANSELIRVSADATTRGAMTTFPVPEPASSTPGAYRGASGIAPGPDGALWFMADKANRIGKMTTAGAFSFVPMTEYPDIKVSGARDIVRGPDAAMWITRYSGGMITRVAADGTQTDFRLPGTDTYVALQDITSGPDSKVWFIRSGQRAIGSITTSGTPTMYPLPAGVAFAAGIDAGPDGAIWFTGVTTVTPRRGIVGRLSPTGTYSLFDLGSYVPRAIHTAGGQLWLGSEIVGGTGHALLRMTASGVVTRYEPLLFQPDISGITTGPDSAIWFTDLSGAQVGRVDGMDVPVTGAPSPISIAPGSLAVTDTGASVVLDAGVSADLELRAGLTTTAATASALRVKNAKRVVVPRTKAVGRVLLSVKSGKRRVPIRLSAAGRRALRRGAPLRIAVRATEASMRKTVVQALLRRR